MPWHGHSLPRFVPLQQRFPETPPLHIDTTVRHGIQSMSGAIRPGMRIAVAVGSRGITRLQEIVKSVLTQLQEAGAKPFIVPAMGSHGGATATGQIELLGEYGISESALGVPLNASMETTLLGSTPDHVPVHFSRAALEADGIVLVNRVKPHTDFQGTLGSGLLKMMVVGLGKREGASTFHRASNRIGFEHMLRTVARVTLSKARILFGVAILEDHAHQPARIEMLRPEQMESGEERLFKEAERLMPRLPFTDVDLLIVDCMGKNISGAGMDPNVIGRSVHGYSSLLKDRNADRPAVRRLFVRELTPESHGNATGIGMADFTTTRLVESIDREITTLNTLTAMTPQGVKIPIYFDTDKEAIDQALDTLALEDTGRARILRIQDTLSLEHLTASEAYLEEIERSERLEVSGPAFEMRFDEAGRMV